MLHSSYKNIKEPLTFFRYQLTTLIIMVLIMIAIGGITRLSGAGLSIVEWKPITGILPPLNREAWEHLFAAYQQSPEYKLINAGMGLEDFKTIFWLEYLHRLWGRLMGIALLIPLVYTYIKPILKEFRLPLVGLLLLGMCQGVMGWIMVKSGLYNDPHVNPLCLMMHLGLAMLTFCWLIYLHAQVLPKKREGKLLKSQKILIVFIGVTMLYGGLVAGHKAGLIYNEFPFMNGKLIPEEAWYLTPLWKNFLLNPATVQWIHRVLAVSTLLFTSIMAYRYVSYRLLWGMVMGQAILGIITLIYHVPVTAGVVHQLWAFCLLAVALRVAKPPSQQAY